MIEGLDILGNSHTIKLCSKYDIPVHYKLISEFIPDEEESEFQSRMLECVEEGTAFSIHDDSCFLYYKKEDVQPKFAQGVALYGMGNPLKIMALFSGVFLNIDKKTFVINFKTHPGKFVSEYKSILTTASIKRHNIDNSTLMVRVDDIKNKILALYKKRGI